MMSGAILSEVKEKIRKKERRINLLKAFPASLARVSSKKKEKKTDKNKKKKKQKKSSVINVNTRCM